MKTPDTGKDVKIFWSDLDVLNIHAKNVSHNHIVRPSKPLRRTDVRNEDVIIFNPSRSIGSK